MNFKTWLLNENVVRTENIGEAIKQSIEFAGIPGKWSFTIKPHNWAGAHNCVRITATLNRGIDQPYFLVSTFAILEKPLETYDSKIGADGLRIVSGIMYLDGQGNYKKLSERGDNPLKKWSDFDGKSLKTPYQLAKWVKNVIENFKEEDDGDGDVDSPMPAPQSPQLVGV